MRVDPIRLERPACMVVGDTGCSEWGIRALRRRWKGQRQWPTLCCDAICHSPRNCIDEASSHPNSSALFKITFDIDEQPALGCLGCDCADRLIELACVTGGNTGHEPIWVCFTGRGQDAAAPLELLAPPPTHTHTPP